MISQLVEIMKFEIFTGLAKYAGRVLRNTEVSPTLQLLVFLFQDCYLVSTARAVNQLELFGRRRTKGKCQLKQQRRGSVEL